MSVKVSNDYYVVDVAANKNNVKFLSVEHNALRSKIAAAGFKKRRFKSEAVAKKYAKSVEDETQIAMEVSRAFSMSF